MTAGYTFHLCLTAIVLTMVWFDRSDARAVFVEIKRRRESRPALTGVKLEGGTAANNRS